MIAVAAMATMTTTPMAGMAPMARVAPMAGMATMSGQSILGAKNKSKHDHQRTNGQQASLGDACLLIKEEIRYGMLGNFCDFIE